MPGNSHLMLIHIISHWNHPKLVVFIQVVKNSQPSGKVDPTWLPTDWWMTNITFSIWHVVLFGCCLVVFLPLHYAWIKHCHLIRNCKIGKSACVCVWRQNTLHLMFSLKSNQDQTDANVVGSPAHLQSFTVTQWLHHAMWEKVFFSWDCIHLWHHS